VLSPAHASALLWPMLHLMRVQPLDPDYEVLGTPAVSLDDLRRFRQLDSKAPEHPEHRWTSGKGNADIDAKQLTMATNTHATRNGRPRPEGAGLVRRLRLGFRGSGSPDRVAPAGSRLARDCVGVKLSLERRVLTGRDRIVQTIRARNCVIVNTRMGTPVLVLDRHRESAASGQMGWVSWRGVCDWAGRWARRLVDGGSPAAVRRAPRARG